MVKGIWIERDFEDGMYYSTFLKEREKDVIGFIPFEHPYEPRYLGSIGFLDISRKEFTINSRLDVDHGWLQNHFYPLGGDPAVDRPELVGKGLARRIELAVAEDLAKQFPENTPIAIAATSDSHIAYCQRLGISPFKPMALAGYIARLNRS